MIEGVIITALRTVQDERGKLMCMLRNDKDPFTQFGEIYFSYVYPGVVKGWHRHKKMTLNYAVPAGEIKLVIFDDRRGSKSEEQIMELFIGESNYSLVTIPPGVWSGFKGIGTERAMVANCASIPHDPEEIERLEPLSPKIPYNWKLQQ